MRSTMIFYSICRRLQFSFTLFMFIFFSLAVLKRFLSSNESIQYNPKSMNVTNSLDTRTSISIANYFRMKSLQQKHSPFRIVIPNVLSYSSNRTNIFIYEYTYHGGFCRRRNQESIFMVNCPFRNCQFTCNASFQSLSDAVIMHYGNLNHLKLTDFNRVRNSNQIWLLYHDEPSVPARVYNQFLFNWTMSYRWSSEISVAAYGITFLRDTPMNISEFKNWLHDNFQRRKNQAVWFVNNCGPQKRMQIYRQLKGFYPVTPFGGCFAQETNQSNTCPRDSTCELDQLSGSKFYLAFESSSSRQDYITEKFWRALSHGIIPIVIGPKRQDYERVAPDHSFIYAEDYIDAKALAKYLNHVAHNMSAYEYHQRWRINHETRYRGTDVDPVRFCELCYKLNMNRHRIWYTDVNQYFSEEQ